MGPTFRVLNGVVMWGGVLRIRVEVPSRHCEIVHGEVDEVHHDISLSFPLVLLSSTVALTFPFIHL